MKLFQDTNLWPLEIWHGVTRHGPLHLVRSDFFADALGDFLRGLHEGRAVTLREEDNDILREVQKFGRVLLTGRRAPLLAAAFVGHEGPFKIEIVPPTSLPFFPGLTLDWGQTAIKAATTTQARIYPRDWSEFPPRQEGASATPRQREKLRQKLRAVLDDFAEPEQLCLGLPLKMNSSLWAEPSTYEGLEGFLPDLFADLDLPPTTIINDAVLAALPHRPKPGEGSCLVITLGYGVGGALWTA